MIDNYPTQTGQADKLAQLEADYKAVFRTLRTELSWQQRMFKQVKDEDEREFRQGKINDAQQALDALVRIKDVAKLALLEQRLSVEQQWKQDELIQDVEFKPVRLSY